MELTRRAFLGTCASAGLLATMGAVLPGCSTDDTFEELAASGGGETSYGYCRMCMMGRCGTVVTTENGVVTQVAGNPDAAVNKGRLCPRGNSAIMQMYNPYRIKTPLKRTNPEKGMDVDPEWVEISWDEAFDLVGAS